MRANVTSLGPNLYVATKLSESGVNNEGNGVVGVLDPLRGSGPAGSSNPLSHQRQRFSQVERGIFDPRARGPPRRIWVVHEGPPHWLGALRIDDVKSLALWGPRTFKAVRDRFWTMIIERFRGRVSQPSEYSEFISGPTPDILLGCGSTAYLLTNFPLAPGIPSIALITGEGRSQRSPRGLGHGAGWKWKRITHASVGGATTGAYLIGFRGLDPPAVHSELRRTLRHVLDYSLRGMSYSAVRGLSIYYSENDRLRSRELERPIVYHSSFSATGLCHRSLSSRELAMAFDLPTDITAGMGELLSPEVFPSLIPFKVLEAVWTACLSATAPALGLPRSGSNHGLLGVLPGDALSPPCPSHLVTHPWSGLASCLDRSLSRYREIGQSR